MKTSKPGTKLILWAFIIVICLSIPIWFVARRFVDTTNYENRELAKRPSLSTFNYDTFASDFTNYFNDNIPFRNYLISLNSAIDYYIFDKSSSDYVIKGKDGWLFYNRNDDGDPISCYTGTNLLNDSQLQALAQNCLSQRDYIENQGKEFVIFIAPNKERMYSEYMPEIYGSPADKYITKQIIDYLKANTDLRIVYPYDELIEAKSVLSYNLWYKTDTHWNELGAYIGASSLLKELGIVMPSLIDEDMEITPIKQKLGDLSTMIHLSKQLQNGDYEFDISGYDKHQIQSLGEDLDSGYKAKNADSRKIYIQRDSYSISMGPIIGSQFSETKFMHFGSYTNLDLTSFNPDVVVYQTTERYANSLATFKFQ